MDCNCKSPQKNAKVHNYLISHIQIQYCTNKLWNYILAGLYFRILLT